MATVSSTKTKTGFSTNAVELGSNRAMAVLGKSFELKFLSLCQTCLRQGIATEAKAVDHIKAKAFGGTDEETNLQAICHACHKVKTANERFNQNLR